MLDREASTVSFAKNGRNLGVDPHLYLSAPVGYPGLGWGVIVSDMLAPAARTAKWGVKKKKKKTLLIIYKIYKYAKYINIQNISSI